MSIFTNRRRLLLLIGIWGNLKTAFSKPATIGMLSAEVIRYRKKGRRGRRLCQHQGLSGATA